MGSYSSTLNYDCITTLQSPGSSKYRTLLSHVSRDQKYNIKMSADLISPKANLLALLVCLQAVCVITSQIFSVHIRILCAPVVFSFSCRDASPIKVELHFYSFVLNYLCQGQTPSHRVLELQRYDFVGMQFIDNIFNESWTMYLRNIPVFSGADLAGTLENCPRN